MTEKRLTHSTAHYLLSIHKLFEGGARSRLVDIARELDIARSSATIAIRKLKEKGLVEEDVNHNLRLTVKAHDEVHDILSNRTLLFYFFKDVLGVDKDQAADDACHIEHLISAESQRRLFKFMKKISTCNESSVLEKIDIDLCLCDYEKLEDFKEEQEGDSYLSK